MTQADEQAQQRGEQLAEHGRPRRARHAHAERDDEHDIQHDVEQRREHEEDQRRFAVSQRAQHIRDHVVEDRRARAEQDDEHVGVGVGVYVRRRFHPVQDGVRETAERRRDEQRKADGQQPRDRDAAPHPGFVVRAAALAETDAEAARKALHEAEHEVDDARRGADGGQRVRAERAADDDRVRDGVEKLKQTAADDRQRKTKQNGKRFALGQILCHKNASCLRRNALHSVQRVIVYHRPRRRGIDRIHEKNFVLTGIHCVIF